MGAVQNALMLGLGFIAIRLLGQGSLMLVSQNVINQWWVRRRGTVMGISGLLVSLLGLGAFPVFINWLLPHYGWRMSYVLLGGLVWLLMLPLGLIFYRNRPEAYGLQPDGDLTHPPPDQPHLPVAEEDWTLPEASHTTAFWLVALGTASIGMLSTGLFFHMVSIFTDNGLTAAVAASVFFPIALTSALVNLSSGVLVDYLPPRFLLATALLFQTLALVMAQLLQGATTALIYGVVMGITFGLLNTVNSVIWPSYFGRRYLGSITGSSTTIMIVGAALGPLPLGVARDLLGSYNLALTLLAVLPFGLGVANLFWGKPEK
jgi:MFS family permease